ncbi:hypothetical protein Nepgr_018619 [Nepenthes gracilis]|uniref:Uncharacterized protein n=1 Tax=Nepenthes gracilis TaxID=150966 RepID=A0AAD3SSJ9_NEPGR|nr:hypothetical protein Nepgr_018619 [Nepenthes gracilis]
MVIAGRRNGNSSKFMATVLALFFMGLMLVEFATPTSTHNVWPRKMVGQQSYGYLEGEDLAIGGGKVAPQKRCLRTSTSRIPPPTKNEAQQEGYFPPPPLI